MYIYLITACSAVSGAAGTGVSKHKEILILKLNATVWQQKLNIENIGG